MSSTCGRYCDGTETTYNSVPILKKKLIPMKLSVTHEILCVIKCSVVFNSLTVLEEKEDIDLSEA